jgi:hypothetical protein
MGYQTVYKHRSNGTFILATMEASLVDAMRHVNGSKNNPIYEPIGIFCAEDKTQADMLFDQGSHVWEWFHQGIPATPTPRRPKPAIPPEVWSNPPADVDYMAAVRSLCKGN